MTSIVRYNANHTEAIGGTTSGKTVPHPSLMVAHYDNDNSFAFTVGNKVPNILTLSLVAVFLILITV